MNLDELDKSFDRAEANADHEGVFLEQLFTAYPSLSAKLRESEKQIAALTAERDSLRAQVAAGDKLRRLVPSCFAMLMQWSSKHARNEELPPAGMNDLCLDIDEAIDEYDKIKGQP